MEQADNQFLNGIHVNLVQNVHEKYEALKQKISTRKTELYQKEVKIEIIEEILNHPRKNDEEIAQLVRNQNNRPTYANMSQENVLNQTRAARMIPDKAVIISSLKLEKDEENQKIMLMAKHKELLQKWSARAQAKLEPGAQEVQDEDLAMEYINLMQMVRN